KATKFSPPRAKVSCHQLVPPVSEMKPAIPQQLRTCGFVWETAMRLRSPPADRSPPAVVRSPPPMMEAALGSHTPLAVYRSTVRMRSLSSKASAYAFDLSGSHEAIVISCMAFAATG